MDRAVLRPLVEDLEELEPAVRLAQRGLALGADELHMVGDIVGDVGHGRQVAGDRRVLVVAQRHGADNDPDRLEALYPIGVTASIIDRQTQVDGVLKVSVSGLRRMAIVRLINGEFLAAEAAPIEEERCESREATILSRAVLDAYQVYANLDFSSLSTAPKARFGLPSIGDPGLLADTLAPLLSIGVEQRQQLLEASDIVSRLEKILDLMNSSGPAN